MDEIRKKRARRKVDHESLRSELLALLDLRDQCAKRAAGDKQWGNVLVEYNLLIAKIKDKMLRLYE